MSYILNRDLLNRLDPSHLEEWVLANGLGGFSAGSVINAAFRKQHGYLIIAKNPPIRRFLVLSRTDEKLTIGQEEYDLSSQKHPDRLQRGDQYLESFVLDEAVTYRYALKGITLEKTIAPWYGHNAVGITYRIKTGPNPAKLTITPLFNHRPHSDITSSETLQFAEKRQDRELDLIPESDPETTIRWIVSEGEFVPEAFPVTEPFFYDFEAGTGDPRTDVHYKPYSLTVELPAGTERIISAVCTIETGDIPGAEEIIRSYRDRMKTIVKNAGYADDFVNRLVRSADQFVCHRVSTGKTTVLAGLPWFTDWGRDTMIAFEGLMLVTKRFAEAKEILQSFAMYERNGLIPNMFPDDDEDPYYNTVDASLWFVHAVDRYLDYTHDEEFVQAEMFPCLKSIVRNYRKGTAFSIRMDNDGLIMAGSGLDQVTWMDVRINGECITPRHGKPVEINALWYRALRILTRLSKRFHEEYLSYYLLAEKVKFHFNRRFWNREKQCLFDVVDANDGSVRPNQLYAISLPDSPVSPARAKKILETVTKELFDTFGIRTLSSADPRFKPVYSGPLETRDRAYHMGTAWPFLTGAYVDALIKTGNDPDTRKRAKAILLNFNIHLNQGCLNGIAEIFDGFHGMISRGCYSQAWSVAEILRSYVSNHLCETCPERK